MLNGRVINIYKTDDMTLFLRHKLKKIYRRILNSKKRNLPKESSTKRKQDKNKKISRNKNG
ncbi:MAG TPA: hypothetical protein PLD77_02680 [Candidatus Dojkabacteria bacterium]|jgi:hypothetical protein|nr:hypothetical protein [Candidatus Dojkabacteria bacterium]